VLLLSPLPVVSVLADMPLAHWALLLGIGACGSLGHLLLIFALGVAPTATLVPFLYVQIAWAAALAYLVTGHVPDRWAWVGMAVIAVCGATSAWLNVRSVAGRRARLDAPVVADTLAD
jgi:drug/metabolite transporter (DMT)-like permease